MIGYSNKALRPLVLIMPKISGCVKTFKVKEGDENKKKINWCLSVEIMKSYQKI